jgi:curli production assembly/transport component CsgG/holdfast attachment protein HfaB
MYVMNVGLDLRLVDTTTLQVVDVVSYQKQIIGRQISAGVFDFLGQTFFDASVGESALEPIQLAVRSVIERAVLEMMSRLYHTPPNACTGDLGTANDPVTDISDRRQVPGPAYVQPATTAMNEEKYYDTSRQEPYRWYGASDATADDGLRGQLQ